MKDVRIWKQELAGGVYAGRLASLYCCTPQEAAAHAARYAAALDGLEAKFGPHSGALNRAAPRSAATTPTISTAVSWRAASTSI